MRLTDPVTEIRGVGGKTAAAFRKLKIETVQDLIELYPRRYLGYQAPVPVRSAPMLERCTIQATICTAVKVNKGPRFTVVTAGAQDATGSVELIWFNMPFLGNVLRKGETYCFTGLLRWKGRRRTMEQPEYFTPYKYQEMRSVLQPVYPLTAGVKNNQLRKAVQEVGEVIRTLPDPLPKEAREEYGLLPLSEAMYGIHFPKDEASLSAAVRRLAFDEFYRFLQQVQELREENVRLVSTHVLTEDAMSKLQGFLAGLPFALTKGQQEALNDVLRDMSGGSVMNRLIQGDVGCGKTIVAAAALFVTALSGYQGALMVPTEVLAMQHFKDLEKLFAPYKMKVALLTGSMTAKEKRAVYEELTSGSVQIVVGTHALIQEKVNYRSLGLVVTDEQHRFGVRQRDRLAEKGELPHVLVMSATPIPRTLAIILYADLDISLITELPGGRKRILNCVVGTDYRPTAYKFIQKEVAAGHQAYVICPKVEDSEGTPLENVTDYAEMLRGVYGERVRVASLHGRMKDAEKQQILQDFTDRKIDVLVSTTVIEVGINNPNATVMMIEDAERFGLAQLHQLRGRVGRGEAQGYCIFINAVVTPESKERLGVLEASNDGFHIAAEDLKLRGPGDFFGVRQSGDLMFRLADIYHHADVLKAAQECVLKYRN
ncbi:MAG: ATP-dependent DNA helicase RecG [Eubacterium sp.]|nr:ATP-dependent DNA helicase RecG [Eubacterium sp.]